MRERTKELANSGDYFVTEKIELHPEYKRSTGLWANVDLGLINADKVIKFINDFRDSGYKSYTGTKKFSYTWDELEQLQNSSKR
jgi:hypothetical protein